VGPMRGHYASDRIRELGLVDLVLLPPDRPQQLINSVARRLDIQDRLEVELQLSDVLTVMPNTLNLDIHLKVAVTIGVASTLGW
jgi:hypothetical protein